MQEFTYIDWIRNRTPAHERVLAGPGDDCAILSPRAAPLLVTTDMLLEGTHFCLAEVSAHRVGRKAMAVNLSDIAAMAGKPIAAVASVGLPRQGPPGLAAQLYEGMREIADAFDVPIIGGDTNSWPGGLVLSITVFGDAPPLGAVMRSGARPGDWLLVTGALGGSILGKHLDFTPRIVEAQLIQKHAPIHAMIDISDGLAGDLHHICTESRCGAVLDAAMIPISTAAQQLADARSPLQHALTDGEDFELLFAVDPADGARLIETQPISGMTLYHVGECIAEAGMFLEENGVHRPLPPGGYEHEIP